jgi:dephospho-CoA kinase
VSLRVGLTGGIGSGKSTVAKLLMQHGANLVDSDAIARQLSGVGGAAVPAISLEFGAHFIGPTGALDRERMRALVFADPAAKLRLEAIMHPLIGLETERQAASANSSVLVFDVPLLAESTHWRSRVDRVLVVDCSEEVQIERVMSRSSLSRESVCAIIEQQATRAQRRACADAVIHNEAMISLEELAAQLNFLWDCWTA